MASVIKRLSLGNVRGSICDVPLPASYVTGGVALAPADVGMESQILLLQAQMVSGYFFEWDGVNGKMLVKNTAQLTTAAVLAQLSGGDIKGSANTDAENADAATEPTSGHTVAAAAAVAAGAWAHGALTNPDQGRNVCIVIDNPTGGILNLFQGVMTFLVTGTWRGAAQTENITITSSAGNKPVAAGKWRFKYGVKPFDTVTNVTLDNVPDNALTIAAGLGSKIGLIKDLLTPAEADVTRITKNAAFLSPVGLVDTVNMTVNLGVLTDGDDFSIEYKTSSPASAAAAEVVATTNLSAVTARVLVFGV